MGVHIDKSGADDLPRSVYSAGGLNLRNVAPHYFHLVPGHGNSAVKSRIPGAIDNHAVGDQEVKHALILRALFLI